MEEGGSGVLGGTGVTVMTDEQIEMLRKQIAIYTSIVKQLLQKHRELCAHQDLSSSGTTVMPLGIPYSHPLLPPSGHKIPSRQRWSPKPEQLQILERAFEQSNTTPSKEKIKKLTTELAQHGQVAESNVYNWFQNRRARCKRKQSSLAPTSNNAEPQLRTQIVDSSQEKKRKKPEDIQPEVGSPPLYDHLYNPDPDIGLDQVMGNKLDAPTGLSPYWNMKQNDMYE